MTQATHDCTGCPVSAGTYKPADAMHQIGEQAAELTDQQIDDAFARMPDGVQGFLKSWGYRQFARAIARLVATSPAVPEPQAALAKRLIGDVRSADEIATAACRRVAELPDRDSPADWPETMLVTHEELHTIVREAVIAGQATPAHPAEGVPAPVAVAVAVPDSAAYPNPDEIRAIARSVSTGASDSPSPSEYVMAGYRAALAATPAAPELQDAGETNYPRQPKWIAGTLTAIFPAGVLGHPMREFAPGKWESANWPSESKGVPAAAPDAWRDGARFALEAVSKVDSICWLTDDMKVTCIKLAADAVIAERDRQRAAIAAQAGKGE